MYKRLIMLAVISALAVAPLTTFAQPDPRCIALEEADCTLYTQALDHMKTVGSFNNKAFSLQLAGSGGTSEGNALDIMGSGPMLVNESGSISALSLDVNGDLTGSGEASSGQLVWLDNVLYVAAPNENDELEWTGTPTAPEDSDLLLQVLNGSLLDTAFTTPGAAVVIRGDDAEMDGQTMAVFEVQIDLITFLLAPNILSSLETLMASTSGESTGFSMGEEEIDLAAVIQLLPLLLSKDTVEATLWINPEDGLVYHLEFLMDIVLDATMIDPEIGETSLTFNLVTDLDQHSAEFAIEAPAEYEMLDTSSIDFSSLALDLMSGQGGLIPTDTEPAPLAPVEDTLGYGETVSGVLGEDNTQDIWGFEAAAGDVITITMKATNPESSLDTRIFLQTAEGEQLAFNDDHENESADLMIFDAQLEGIKIPTDGEYRIVATWLIPDEDGNYELILEKVN
jgi:hypothetical protein